MSLKKRVDKLYKIPVDGRGVDYGAYRIELTAVLPEQRLAIEQEHWAFIHKVAESDQMKDLSKAWLEVVGLQERMQTIAGNAIKSSDIVLKVIFNEIDDLHTIMPIVKCYAFFYYYCGIGT